MLRPTSRRWSSCTRAPRRAATTCCMMPAAAEPGQLEQLAEVVANPAPGDRRTIGPPRPAAWAAASCCVRREEDRRRQRDAHGDSGGRAERDDRVVAVVGQPIDRVEAREWGRPPPVAPSRRSWHPRRRGSRPAGRCPPPSDADLIEVARFATEVVGHLPQRCGRLVSHCADRRAPAPPRCSRSVATSRSAKQSISSCSPVLSSNSGSGRGWRRTSSPPPRCGRP